MYSIKEASAIRQQFWTKFGQYMSPLLSATGQKVNWINYKTGVKWIRFKMDATGTEAIISIEVSANTSELLQHYFTHMKSFRAALEEELGESWHWNEQAFNDAGKSVGKIFTSLPAVNVLKESDWPQIISFLKPRILSLDRFWSVHKDIFEMMV
ncbi:MAG TPA: DUF4268 domain-containing protein [Ferruginibacter sp.]|nr:DUF4268 domain-containing protein [Ferruginibacter sp.]